MLNGVSNPLFDDWNILNHHLAQWIPIVNPIVAKSSLFDSLKKKKRHHPSWTTFSQVWQVWIPASYSLILCFRFPVSTVFAIKINDQSSHLAFWSQFQSPSLQHSHCLTVFIKKCNNHPSTKSTKSASQFQLDFPCFKKDGILLDPIDDSDVTTGFPHVYQVIPVSIGFRFSWITVSVTVLSKQCVAATTMCSVAWLKGNAPDLETRDNMQKIGLMTGPRWNSSELFMNMC